MELDREHEEAIIKEAIHMSQHKLKPLISKRWNRLALHGGIVFFKLLIVGFVLAFLTLLLLAWVLI